MKYYIKRDLNEYGPYTLADLQRYVAQGNIALTDLTRSEGLNDWVPVSQVIGNIPVPVPVQAPAAYAGATVYGGQSAYGTAPAMATSPVPPDFHWALVLLIGVVSCGLFLWAWTVVEAVWIRKIKPQSKGLLFVLLALVCIFLGGFINGFVGAFNHGHAAPPYGSLFTLGGYALDLIGIFTMRSDLEDYYNSTENIGLRLSGVMTFFFAVFYFQYHFSRIAKWKKTGVLEPQ
jgi:GYF domain 2